MRPLTLKSTLSAIFVAAIAGALFFEANREETRLHQLQLSIQSLQERNRKLAVSVQRRGITETAGRQERASAEKLAREMDARKARVDSGTMPPRELQAGLKPISALSYAGQSTPLATADSGLWAIYHGDVDQLKNLIAFTPAGKEAAVTLFSRLPVETQAQLQTPEYMMALLVAYGSNAVGYQVLGDHQNGDDPTSWTVQAEVQLEDGRTARPNTPLRNVNGNWQFEFDQNAVRQYAIFLSATAAPPPAPAK